MLIDATDGGLPQEDFDRIATLFDAWLSFGGRETFRAQCATNRYDFVIIDARPSYYAGNYRFEAAVYPRGEGHREYKDNGKMIVTVPAPTDALPGYYTDAVTSDPALIYRGMAWEEWEFIQQTGTIHSRGDYNIGQEGLTLWGTSYSTAAYYANGFAPWPFKPALQRPSVVIAIPAERAIDTHHEVPEGERATRGPIEANAIVAAWQINATEIVSGSHLFETNLRTTRPSLEQGSGRSPEVTVVVSPIEIVV